MKSYAKSFLLLLGIAWTTVLLVQLLEFPYHLEFARYQNLLLPLFLIASGVYAIIGIPFLLLIFLFIGGPIHAIWRKGALAACLVLWCVALWFFQDWAIRNALLAVSLTYFVALGIVLVLVLCICFSRYGRIVLCLTGVVLITVLIGWRMVDFWVPRWVKQGEGPNILLVVADTLRKDHTTLYGYERDTTPYLAKLAQSGMIFDNVLSTSSWTKPAMASLLTSRYLERDRILIGPLPIQWSGMRLPEFFYKVGYDTALLTANPNTGSYFEATRGYKWIVQAKPPRHFALENFVLPKLFNIYVRMREWLSYKNSRDRIKSYQEVLGFSSLSELSDFSRGHRDSDAVPPEELEAYRKQAKLRVSLYTLYNIRVYKRFPAWRIKWVVPYLDPLYRAILKFCFVTLEGARGEIVDHWIRDRDLSESFKHWYTQERDPSRPFLAHLQYMGPHTPYQEQPPHLLPHFDAESEFNVEMPPDQHTLPSRGTKKLPPNKMHNLVANYDDSIRSTDSNIHDVVTFLKEQGELENTVILFVSDHGEAFYEHRIYGHMYSLYSELVNVPMFIRWPAKVPAGRNDIAASLVDIFPTLAVLSGHQNQLERVPDLEGISLLTAAGQAVVQDHSERVRYGITRVTDRKWKKTARRSPDRKPRESIHRMVVRGDAKLVEEIEPPERRLYLFSLQNPEEPLKTADPQDPQVAELYQLFRELPADYQDINEPEVGHQLKQ